MCGLVGSGRVMIVVHSMSCDKLIFWAYICMSRDISCSRFNLTLIEYTIYVFIFDVSDTGERDSDPP